MFSDQLRREEMWPLSPDQLAREVAQLAAIEQEIGAEVSRRRAEEKEAEEKRRAEEKAAEEKRRAEEKEAEERRRWEAYRRNALLKYRVKVTFAGILGTLIGAVVGFVLLLPLCIIVPILNIFLHLSKNQTDLIFEGIWAGSTFLGLLLGLLWARDNGPP